MPAASMQKDLQGRTAHKLPELTSPHFGYMQFTLKLQFVQTENAAVTRLRILCRFGRNRRALSCAWKILKIWQIKIVAKVAKSSFKYSFKVVVMLIANKKQLGACTQEALPFVTIIWPAFICH